MIYIADQSSKGERVRVPSIAKATDSPEAFIAKILQKLVRYGALSSEKGPKGGFEISKDKISTVMLIDIVDAIDGADIYTQCGLGLKNCSAKNPCPIHDQYGEIKNNLRNLLTSTSLLELAKSRQEGQSVLKI